MIINRLPDMNLIIFSGLLVFFSEPYQFSPAAEYSPSPSIEAVSGIERKFTGIYSGEAPLDY